MPQPGVLPMQLIVAFEGNAETYAESAAHLGIVPPDACPNCRSRIRLLALGYYSRWVALPAMGKVAAIKVRRFRCPVCGLTTSMLPDFAQPYRLVETDTVDRYLAGARGESWQPVWSGLLDSYRHRFEERLPETARIMAATFGLTVVAGPPVEHWDRMRRHLGGSRPLTARLAEYARATVFGIYSLILKVWGGDPLECPCCKGTMRPVRTFIRPEEIQKRRRLVGVLDRNPRRG